MAELNEVEQLALELLAEHLDPSWSFAFDRAKQRAGICNFTSKRITVSRHLAAMHPLEAMQQVLVHEIAHARAGHAAGHGVVWLREARALGYEGGTRHTLSTPTELARYLGRCPNGHEIMRFRRPDRRPRSCSRCSRRFDERYLIRWYVRRAEADAA